MDANKLKVLRDIKYEVRACCGMCGFATFPNNDWGTCGLHKYAHIKHGGQRNLSITKYGWCSEFKQSSSVDLEKFQEFLTK